MKPVRKPRDTALRQAGIEGCTFHTLRHTFASYLVVAGVDLVTVKELLGYSFIKAIMRYAHLAPEHRRAAVTKLEMYLTGGGELAAEA